MKSNSASNIRPEGSALGAQHSKSILVTGANGQLGSELRALTNNPTSNIQHLTFCFTDRSDLDITDRVAIEKYCEEYNIDAIINCAAYTAVDKAESEPELADAINHRAVETLAHIAKANGTSLIHISTDYVFDGSNFKPYAENDPTNPQGVYGQTKLDGEEAMLAINPPDSVIIRTSWVYSQYGNNFVKTMLRLGRERDELGVIFDQVGTPTYARDLAETILKIVLGYGGKDLGDCKLDRGDSKENKDTKSYPQNPNSGTEIYHFSNEGVASWYDFAKTIFELAGIDCRVNAIETKEYPTPATRPHYSLLNKAKIKKDFKLKIPYWRDSLQICLHRILDNGDGI